MPRNKARPHQRKHRFVGEPDLIMFHDITDKFIQARHPVMAGVHPAVAHAQRVQVCEFSNRALSAGAVLGY